MGMGTSPSCLAGGVPAWTRARFEPTLEPSAAAVWCTELASGLVVGNAMLALFFGLPEGMTEAIPIQRLFAAIHPSDIVRVIATRESSIARRDRFEVVYRVLGRDRQRIVLARTRVVRDASARAVQSVGEAYELQV